ncbi:hypothetical protein GALMADRAFT_245375, partial [Galerina marginata CBS 339.88]
SWWYFDQYCSLVRTAERSIHAQLSDLGKLVSHYSQQTWQNFKGTWKILSHP